jgi:hypothetical protein
VDRDALHVGYIDELSEMAHLPALQTACLPRHGSIVHATVLPPVHFGSEPSLPTARQLH